MQTPAAKVIAAFKGIRATARALGRNPSTVLRWGKPRAQGGMDGAVPGAVMPLILQRSRELGLGLTADDLIK